MTQFGFSCYFYGHSFTRFFKLNTCWATQSDVCAVYWTENIVKPLTHSWRITRLRRWSLTGSVIAVIILHMCCISLMNFAFFYRNIAKQSHEIESCFGLSEVECRPYFFIYVFKWIILVNWIFFYNSYSFRDRGLFLRKWKMGMWLCRVLHSDFLVSKVYRIDYSLM